MTNRQTNRQASKVTSSLLELLVAAKNWSCQSLWLSPRLIPKGSKLKLMSHYLLSIPIILQRFKMTSMMIGSSIVHYFQAFSREKFHFFNQFFFKLRQRKISCNVKFISFLTQNVHQSKILLRYSNELGKFQNICDGKKIALNLGRL